MGTQTEITNIRRQVEALRQELLGLNGTINRYMNREEVAEYIDSTAATIAVMTSRREIPHIKRGRRVLYDRQAIDAWLAAQRVEPLEVA